MAWYWRANPEFEAIAGVDGLTVSAPFDTQAAAEHWLTGTFEALADRGINILAITTSEIKVSVLIAEEYTELAVRVLHTAYGLDKAA